MRDAGYDCIVDQEGHSRFVHCSLPQTPPPGVVRERPGRKRLLLFWPLFFKFLELPSPKEDTQIAPFPAMLPTKAIAMTSDYSNTKIITPSCSDTNNTSFSVYVKIKLVAQHTLLSVPH